MTKRQRFPGCLHFGRGLRHALAFAVTLHRRCVVNKEGPVRVASQLGLDSDQTKGVVRLLRKAGCIPSVERLAVIAMRDPDFTDEDIAEMFGKSEEWSADVRAKRDAIRASEPLPLELEMLTELDYRDGTAAERKSAIRETRQDRLHEAAPQRPAMIRTFRWNDNGTFVQSLPQ